MKKIDAIAAEKCPYGSYVEVDSNGFARPDSTLSCRGGVVKRPPGPKNEAEEGENIEVYTDGPVCAVVDGQTVHIVLEGGRILGGPGSVPRARAVP